MQGPARAGHSRLLAELAVRWQKEGRPTLRIAEDTSNFQRRLYVKNDEHGPAGDPDQYTQSTVERELQFLRFHTVHHFAIIAMILKIQGIETPKDFGFAPSTLAYLSAHGKDNH